MGIFGEQKYPSGVQVLLAVSAIVVSIGVVRRCTTPKAVNVPSAVTATAPTQVVKPTAPVATSTPREAEATPAEQPSQPSNSDKRGNSLCVRSESKIFYLPRAIALELTRGKKKEIVLPQEFSRCLQTGAWTFWVTDFDAQVKLPYRYYFSVSVTINQLLEAKLNGDWAASLPSKAESVKRLEETFGPVPADLPIVRVQLENQGAKDFRLGAVNLDRYLFADPTASAPVIDSKVLNVSRALESNFKQLQGMFFKPSGQRHSKVMDLMLESHATLYAESEVELGVHNLSTLYFLKFGKMPQVFVAKRPRTAPSKPVSYAYMELNEFLKSPSSYLIVDTRSSRTNGSLSLNGSYLMNLHTNGANTLQSLVSRFEKPSTFSLLDKSVKGALPALIEKGKGKSIVLMGLGGKDPLLRLIVRRMDQDTRNRTKILTASFHEIAIYYYFFYPYGFSSAGGSVDLLTGRNFEPFLMLGFARANVNSGNVRQHSDPGR